MGPPKGLAPSPFRGITCPLACPPSAPRRSSHLAVSAGGMALSFWGYARPPLPLNPSHGTPKGAGPGPAHEYHAAPDMPPRRPPRSLSPSRFGRGNGTLFFGVCETTTASESLPLD